MNLAEGTPYQCARDIVHLSLNAFLSRIMEGSLVLTSDSSTVVAYLKKQGGTISWDICRLDQEIIDCSELHMVCFMARYIPR